MQSLSTRIKEREERREINREEEGQSDKAIATMQSIAEQEVAQANEEAGLKGGKLSSQDKDQGTDPFATRVPSTVAANAAATEIEKQKLVDADTASRAAPEETSTNEMLTKAVAAMRVENGTDKPNPFDAPAKKAAKGNGGGADK